MTKNNPLKRCFEELSSNDTQQQQQEEQKEPFQIVLIDIEKAANDRTIHCIEMPLEGNTDNLEYVALSYRWGELQEMMIDTQVGYTASITSFNLYDFYELCEMMTKESDLRSINYVWVDAICVNQTDYERRKTTIYQMTNIYKQAAYIVAVPDLHAEHLSTMTKNADIMEGSRRYSKDIYHLIHGNADELAVIEEKFLDEANVPNDPVLRHWLTKYTGYFKDGFMNYKVHAPCYNPVNALNHIYDTSKLSCTSSTSAHHLHQDNIDVSHHSEVDETTSMITKSACNDSFEDLNHCDKADCPLYAFDYDTYYRKNMGSLGTRFKRTIEWRQLIYDRSISIKQSMEFLTDLIMDWSSRVWVISEYHIAKKKNNLKFWFTQLNLDVPEMMSISNTQSQPNGFTFFKFDFNDRSLSDLLNVDNFSDPDFTGDPLLCDYTRFYTSNPVYLKLLYSLLRQLSQQTFLEKILKSKSSKYEDRFYAILPQSKYEDKITQVDQWNINSLSSVKLKLFEFMDTKDKLNLLFMSGNNTAINKGMALPTFATSTLSSTAQSDYLTLENDNMAVARDEFRYNFNLDNKSTIMLHQPAGHQKKNGSPLCYLNLKPIQSFALKNTENWFFFTKTHHLASLKSLQIDHTDISAVDVVCIPLYCDKIIGRRRRPQYSLPGYYAKYCIFLIGSFKKNQWILEKMREDDSDINFCDVGRSTFHFGSDSHGFNIY
ncbi:hypothetical protein BCR42DRAFT_472306 [Absidia repens]|uniref:Heterokaryon incompatibility domain-containing protein n=1 Tax=Absidia repens TaxID=90262 RepID=A0A1X2I1V9_9FUNG|nr:hypothetical protein BCR42DRAFT_472306 [Absidia repens]